MIPRRHLFCPDHYALLPKWLQSKLAFELHYGMAWKCHPTQKYLELRTTAVRLVLRESEERFSKPQSEQLALIAS